MQQDRIIRMGLAGLGLAHELNGPLTSTALALELLGERLAVDPPPTPAEVALEVTRILGAVQRMAALVQHLRALARGERAGVGPVGLDAIADQAVRLTRPGITALARVQLLRGARAPEACVVADGLLLEQATMCLILNAAEAASSRVEVAVEGTSLVVSDDGPGFATLGEAGQTTKPQGMGVGLALARLIAEDAGGQLLVVAGAQGGAQVRITFAAAEQAAVVAV